MVIRIFKANKNYWYHNRVGDVFTVKLTDQLDKYQVVGTFDCIEISDCIELKTELSDEEMILVLDKIREIKSIVIKKQEYVLAGIIRDFERLLMNLK